MFEVQQGLLAHDREHAHRACRDMQAAAPEHFLTLWARRSLASYDSDPTEGLAIVEKLLTLFADDDNLQLSKLSYLRVLARRDDRLTLLKSICRKKGSDPIFLLQMAGVLRDDARELSQSEALVRRALRYRRVDAGALNAFAGVLWDLRQIDESTGLYRLAACVGDMDENNARSYFLACRHLKQTDTALRMLRDRLGRFGRRSSQPVRSFFWACDQINRDVEGFKALDEALVLRPDDGELKLFAASAHARHGRFAIAERLLETAKSRCAPISWLRGSAEIAMWKGESDRAVSLWNQIAASEPLADDAHRALAQLLAETQSRAAALSHLEKTANRFPHNYRLTQLWLEWLRDESPAEAEPVVRRLIDIHPADGWARRELAGTLCKTGRLEEAMVEAEISLRLDPTNPSAPYFRGMVLARLGRLDEAREAYRATLAISIDADYALTSLVDSCDTPAQKREALAFAQQELIRQTIFGDGLLAYRVHAQRVLNAEEVIASLREALAARNDLWHAWSATVLQLCDMGRGEEAEALAARAAERFPLLPRIWLDLASVYGARGDFEAQAAAIETALEISPGWNKAVGALAQVYERAGQFEKSRLILEQAVRRSPLDPYPHGALADVLWKQGERDAALSRIEQAVKIEPDYRWAWGMLVQWSAELKRPQVAVEIARDLTVRRAGEARSWLVLARTLRGSQALEERLAAVGKAIELSPRDLDAHDLRACLLVEAGKLDEAIAACVSPVWGADTPTRLCARAAWIEAERGNTKLAIEQMRRVVERDPNYYWAWTCLADWYRDTQANEDYLQTARTLIKLFPLDTSSQGYFAEALLRSGDRHGAKEVLRATVAHAPDYEFGAGLLFEMAMTDNDLHSAEQAVALLTVHSPGFQTVARQGLLAVRHGNRPLAAKCLADLCIPDNSNGDHVGKLAEAMDRAGMAEPAEQVLRQRTADEPAPQGIANRLVELLVRKKRWADARAFSESVMAREPVGRDAATTLLFHLGSSEQSGELRQFLTAAGDVLKNHPETWGWTSFALQSIRDYDAVIRWMADWKDRQGVAAWMLVNLAEAYRATGRDADARSIHRHALALNAAPESRGIHTLWTAADAALAGDLASAAELLAKPESKVNRPPYIFLRQMVCALIAARNQKDRGNVRDIVEKAEDAHINYAKDIELKRVRRACLRRLIFTAPGISLRYWALKRWMKA